jgi:CubicO group peptidase (beta-lactamase class C family)
MLVIGAAAMQGFAALLACLCASAAPAAVDAPVWPGKGWSWRSPEELGLSRAKLDTLRDLVGGRGCVVRGGCMAYSWGDQSQSADVASAVKPVISTLLLMAVQEGKLRGADAPVADFEPGLRSLNAGKDARITWRHLASQTSGYGLAEAPGAAWAYNDSALALYFDTLMRKVFAVPADEVLRPRLAEPLGFEDRCTFSAFGREDRLGRLAISVRDFARFGLFILRGGKWQGRQLLRPSLLRMSLESPVPAALPRSAGIEAPMLTGQRSLGGGKNQTPTGPGCYSFNWWINRTDAAGHRLYRDLPPDLVLASGHGGVRNLWIVPSLDLIVSWNDADVRDHDDSPSNPNTRANQAARLIAQSVVGPVATPAAPQRTRVSIQGGQWRINGATTYLSAPAQGLLLNVRMVNATYEDRNRPGWEREAEANTDAFIAKVPEYVATGVRAITLNLQGGAPGYEGAHNSAYEPDGTLRREYLGRVERVIEACDRAGAAVILGCFYQRQDQRLRDEAAVRRAVVEVARRLKRLGRGNVLLEIANEYGHSGFDHPILRSADGQVELMQAARAACPGLLVSTSGQGDGALGERVARASDFILIHLNGTPASAIPSKVRPLLRFGKPVVCNEDQKVGAAGAEALSACVAAGASWGLMAEAVNQRHPFRFTGAADDPAVYARMRALTTPGEGR